MTMIMLMKKKKKKKRKRKQLNSISSSQLLLLLHYTLLCVPFLKLKILFSDVLDKHLVSRCRCYHHYRYYHYHDHYYDHQCYYYYYYYYYGICQMEGNDTGNQNLIWNLDQEYPKYNFHYFFLPDLSLLQHRNLDCELKKNCEMKMKNSETTKKTSWAGEGWEKEIKKMKVVKRTLAEEQ